MPLKTPIIFLMKRKMIFFIAYMFCACLVQAQSIFTRDWQFMGYHIAFSDIARNGDGDIALTGTITIRENNNPDRRDPYLDSIFHVKKDGYASLRQSSGIVLVADKNWKIKNIIPLNGRSACRVLADKHDNSFLLGGWFTDYGKDRPGRNKIFLMRIKPGVDDYEYGTLDLHYEAQMMDMTITPKGVLITSIIDSVISPSRKMYLPAVIETNGLLKTNDDQSYYPVTAIRYVSGSKNACILTTNIATAGTKYYFASSPCQLNDDIRLSIWEYNKSAIRKLNFSAPGQRAFMTNFLLSRDGGFIYTYVNSAYDKYYTIEKTGKNLKPEWTIKVPLSESPTYYSQLIEMPDGKIVASATDEKHEWSYNIYDHTGKLLKQVSTQRPASRTIYKAALWDAGSFISLMADYTTDRRAPTIQVFKVNE